MSYPYREDARSKAETTLNASLAAKKDAMRNGIEEGANAAAASASQAIDVALEQRAGPIRDGRRIAVMNMIAGALAVFATARVLFPTV
jgi:hypothetical protein